MRNDIGYIGKEQGKLKKVPQSIELVPKVTVFMQK